MSSSGYAHGRGERDPGLAGAAAVLLGILVAVLGFFALMMWVTRARDDDCRGRSARPRADARHGHVRERDAPARSRAMREQRPPTPTRSPPLTSRFPARFRRAPRERSRT